MKQLIFIFVLFSSSLSGQVLDIPKYKPFKPSERVKETLVAKKSSYRNSFVLAYYVEFLNPKYNQLIIVNNREKIHYLAEDRATWKRCEYFLNRNNFKFVK